MAGLAAAMAQTPGRGPSPEQQALQAASQAEWSADTAGGVYALYGKRLDRAFPARMTLSDSGALAFRLHDGGHTPAPNWSHFLEFAERNFKS